MQMNFLVISAVALGGVCANIVLYMFRPSDGQHATRLIFWTFWASLAIGTDVDLPSVLFISIMVVILYIFSVALITYIIAMHKSVGINELLDIVWKNDEIFVALAIVFGLLWLVALNMLHG